MHAANNEEISFRDMPPEEQVRILLQQNLGLSQKMKQMNEQFKGYEESDKKLLARIAGLESELARYRAGQSPRPADDDRLHKSQNENERLRKLIDELGGHPDVIAHKRWYAGVVRMYLAHYGIRINELNQFTRFMARGKNPDPSTFFTHESARP